MLDQVIISDLHLGSRACKVKPLFRLLAKIRRGRIRTKALICNGDIFDSADLTHLTEQHSRILGLLMSMPQAMQVVFLRGNHDAFLLDHYFPFQVCDYAILISGGRRIFVSHGHEYEKCQQRRWLVRLSSWLARLGRLLEPSETLNLVLKWASQRWLEDRKSVATGSALDAIRNNCFTAIASHTHEPCFLEVEAEGTSIRYFNTGSFAEGICTFLSVHDGKVRIEEAN